MVRSPRVLLQKAEKLAGKGKIEAALKIYEKVLQEEQNDSGTLNKAGDLYVRLNRIDKAIELFNRTAGFFIEEEFFVKAIAIYKKILRLDPSRLDIGKKLADTYVSQGLINEARTHYGEIAEKYMSQGDVETALAVHHTMVGALPQDPSARLRYAELLEEHNKLKESMSQYHQLAQVLVGEGGTDEAVKVLLRGVQVLPGRLQYIEQAARDLWASGAEEAAKSFLTQATEHNAGAKDVDPNPAGKLSGSSQATVATKDFEATVEEVIEIVDPIDPIGPIDSESSVDRETGSQDLAAGEDSDDLVFELDMTDLETDFSVDTPDLKPLSESKKLDAESELAEIVKAKVPKRDPDAPVRVLSDREKRVAELINEAEVLTRFGMDEKAAERLELALVEDSSHLGTFERLIDSYLKLRQMDRVPSLANRMSVSADEQENPQAFETALGRILEAGFEFENGEFTLPPTDEADGEESTELVNRAVDKVVDDLVVQLAREQAAVRSEDQPTISEDLSVVNWLGEESLVEEVSAEVDLVLPTDEVVSPEEDLVLPADEVASAEVELALPTEAAIKPDSDLIDIAEELMRELDDEDKQKESEKEQEEGEEEDDRIVVTEEESLEDIVRGFREGVDATLSPEDYDTHFNLGIAYREMGLIDEAIGEFQLASKDSRYLIKGCSLLALSYLDKGLPGLAMNAYQLALESKTATEMESVGLRYEIGDLYLTMGDPEAAKEYFVQIYGADSKYRDVAQKLNEIEQAL